MSYRRMTYIEQIIYLLAYKLRDRWKKRPKDKSGEVSM